MSKRICARVHPPAKVLVFAVRVSVSEGDIKQRCSHANNRYESGCVRIKHSATHGWLAAHFFFFFFLTLMTVFIVKGDTTHTEHSTHTYAPCQHCIHTPHSYIHVIFARLCNDARPRPVRRSCRSPPSPTSARPTAHIPRPRRCRTALPSGIGSWSDCYHYTVRGEAAMAQEYTLHPGPLCPLSGGGARHCGRGCLMTSLS